MKKCVYNPRICGGNKLKFPFSLGYGPRKRLIPIPIAIIATFLLGATASFAADAPSETSMVGDTVENPMTMEETTVTKLISDPPDTPTEGDTAFVQTADGYTFLVKSEGDKFYNSDEEPLAFTITEISDNDVTFTNPGASNLITFQVISTTEEFDESFNTPRPSPAEEELFANDTGQDGVRQVNTGRGGSNGRAGALVVPPGSGGSGAPGPRNEVTLNDDVNATSKIGWEVGSVGGNGGRGGNSYLSFWSGRDGGDGGAGGEVIATQGSSSVIVANGENNHGIFAYSRSGKAGNGGSGFAAPGGGTGGHSANGGNVTVNQNGTITTGGDNAHGIYGLSVSNNGGNGGDQWGLVGESGDAGFGGNGGAVTINTDDDASILTTGEFAHGILAQSIGGSGGSAGASGNLLVSLVGKKDNGGSAGTVTVSHAGRIETTGNSSRGIMAQSIGGGGGAGGAGD